MLINPDFTENCMRPLARLLSKQNQLLDELPATITANVWVVRGKRALL
jgi:hypothetical protein